MDTLYQSDEMCPEEEDFSFLSFIKKHFLSFIRKHIVCDTFNDRSWHKCILEEVDSHHKIWNNQTLEQTNAQIRQCVLLEE